MNFQAQMDEKKSDSKERQIEKGKIKKEQPPESKSLEVKDLEENKRVKKPMVARCLDHSFVNVY
jgi:hypothetical protein